MPACQTVAGKLETIRRDSEREIEQLCPGNARYFWNWAAEPSQHVQVVLLELIRDDHKRAIGVRLALTQQSGVDTGYAQVYLGCSAQQPTRRKPITMQYEGFGWHPHQ